MMAVLVLLLLLLLCRACAYEAAQAGYFGSAPAFYWCEGFYIKNKFLLRVLEIREGVLQQAD